MQGHMTGGVWTPPVTASMQSRRCSWLHQMGDPPSGSALSNPGENGCAGNEKESDGRDLLHLGTSY
jgi:hypothetical protein